MKRNDYETVHDLNLFSAKMLGILIILIAVYVLGSKCVLTDFRSQKEQ